MYFYGKKVRQFDLVNTKESILPVCDKPDHKNKRKVQKWEEIEVLRNCALSQHHATVQHGVDWSAKFATIFLVTK